jgi:hypothetical protein
MGAWWYEQEYECRLRLEDADAVFRLADIEAAFSRRRPALRRTRSVTLYPHTIGVELSRSSDYTTVAVLEEAC